MVTITPTRKKKHLLLYHKLYQREALKFSRVFHSDEEDPCKYLGNETETLKFWIRLQFQISVLFFANW
jgi:uncharacterized protein YaeQ